MGDLSWVWFPPAHKQRVVTNRLHELFGNRLIALNEAVEWPLRSPDLTPLDFFLAGLHEVKGVSKRNIRVSTGLSMDTDKEIGRGKAKEKANHL